MDPARPESFNHRVEKLSTGRNYHFVDQLPNGYNQKLNATILCIHGFPDFWYGWRHQIGPWVHEGYRVVVPDMLGYGTTDKPQAVEEYTTKKLCADLVALLDLIGIRKAVVIGHDWGSHTAGRFALWYPDRLVALAMLSVAYTPPSPVYLSIKEVATKAPNLGYQVYFASQRSTTDIEANVYEKLKRFLGVIFRPPSSPVGLTKEGSLSQMLNSLSEFNFYVDVMSKGMNGPLNYYRTSKQRHDEELAARLPSKLRSDLPVLFMWGTKDATVTPATIRKASNFVPRLQDIALEDRGHWIMVEAKEEVTSRVSEWLRGLGESLFTKGKL
ncbi:Bifunctional epoxide hydrolase 2 [Leucoagaricus sp. SymC.cos]|nr:Bifunctional epoxide hydrolase 2 [Leucoagaricus sp. SymC.cos]